MFECEEPKPIVKHDCKKDEDKDEVVDELEKLLIATLESLEQKVHKVNQLYLALVMKI